MIDDDRERRPHRESVRVFKDEDDVDEEDQQAQNAEGDDDDQLFEQLVIIRALFTRVRVGCS